MLTGLKVKLGGFCGFLSLFRFSEPVGSSWRKSEKRQKAAKPGRFHFNSFVGNDLTLVPKGNLGKHYIHFSRRGEDVNPLAFLPAGVVLGRREDRP